MLHNGSFRIEGPTAAPTGYGTSPWSNRVLVVEDDSDLRQLSAEVLAGSGYYVDAVEDGAAGWEALNANSYDLLITDHHMPELSSINLIKKLRSARMAVPVILSSGIMSGEKLELPLVAALPTPFSRDQLLGTVRQVLRATKSDRESWDPSQMRPSPQYADGYACCDATKFYWLPKWPAQSTSPPVYKIMLSAARGNTPRAITS